jgi:hypothetical protein
MEKKSLPARVDVPEKSVTSQPSYPTPPHRLRPVRLAKDLTPAELADAEALAVRTTRTANFNARLVRPKPSDPRYRKSRELQLKHGY